MLKFVCAIAGVAGYPFFLNAEVKLNDVSAPACVFAMIGGKPAAPEPTVLIFATDRKQALQDKSFSEAGLLLMSGGGFLCVSIDLPAHGDDHREGEPGGLKGWRARADKGEDFMSPFTAKVSGIIDFLIMEGYTDVRRIGVMGTSRGGFAALHAMAADPRVSAGVAFSPVTDLRALSEFKGTEGSALTRSLEASRLAPKLAGRNVWIVIGNHDERVNTECCIAFSRALIAATPKELKIAPVHLLVLPSDDHHRPEGSHAMAAAWLARLLK